MRWTLKDNSNYIPFFLLTFILHFSFKPDTNKKVTRRLTNAEKELFKLVEVFK